MKSTLLLAVLSLNAFAESNCEKLRTQFKNQKALYKVFEPLPGKDKPQSTSRPWKQLNWKGKAIPLPPGEVLKQGATGSFFYQVAPRFNLMVIRDSSLGKAVADYKYQYSITPEDYDCRPEVGEALVLKGVAERGDLTAVYKDLNQLNAVSKKFVSTKAFMFETFVQDGGETWIITYTFPDEDTFKKSLNQVLDLGSKLEPAKIDQRAQKAFEQVSFN